jgi:hypothetical protein
VKSRWTWNLVLERERRAILAARGRGIGAAAAHTQEADLMPFRGPPDMLVLLFEDHARQLARLAVDLTSEDKCLR